MANLPALTPTTFAEALTFSEMLSKSSMVPREYQRQPANILLAVQWGAELGLGPLQAVNSIAIINGKPAVYGDAMLALVRGSPLCDDVIEEIKGVKDDDISLASAVCDARRKGKEPVVRAFSVADAKRAGLWDKAGPWKQHPLRMLQMRARGFALRDAFPDVLRGVISAEEAADIPREPRDITPSSPLPVLDDLDAFAAAPDDPAQTSAAVQAATPAAEVSPTEAAIDEENLIFAGRAEAFNGYAAFSQWYRDILDDEQRVALRPHLKGLQQAARQADKDMHER